MITKDEHTHILEALKHIANWKKGIYCTSGWCTRCCFNLEKQVSRCRVLDDQIEKILKEAILAGLSLSEIQCLSVSELRCEIEKRSQS